MMNETTGMAMELAIETGPLSGRRFAVDRPLLTIGRAQDNDVVLDDEMVSKHHARVIVQGNNYLIEDLGSSNGTIVNGQPINSHLLSTGDLLYLGQTNVIFRSALPTPATEPMQVAGAVPPAAAAAAPEVSPADKKSRKALWIVIAVVASILLLGGIATAVLLLLRGGRDSIKPSALITAPATGFQVQLGLPVGSSREVEVTVTASDDKGLDKVEISVNDEIVETLKASKATKDAKAAGPLKEEEFTYKWKTSATGSYTLRARAYDWKGNSDDSPPVTVSIVNGPEIDAANAYCRQIDEMITEYVQYRAKFNKAYEAAKNRTISFAEAGLTFDQVGNERRSLRARLAGITPPAPFAAAQSNFDRQISAAIDADDYAILWARDMEINYPYYQYGYITNPDPNDYEGKMLAASRTSQEAAQSFKAEYNAQRAAQLKIGPGPDPTQ